MTKLECYKYLTEYSVLTILQEAIKLAEAKAKEMLANGELCNIYVRRPTGERFWIVERFLH